MPKPPSFCKFKTLAAANEDVSVRGLTAFQRVVVRLDYKCQRTLKLADWGRLINKSGVYLSELQTEMGCWWRSVTHCDTGGEVASAARYILSVSHQQTLSACLPNTVTAAETEAISLTRLKCK